MQHKFTLCTSERQKLENMKTGNGIAPTYLRRCQEAATTAAGRDPPPHLGVVVDNKRRRQQQQQDSKRAVATVRRRRRRRRRRRKVGFLCTIVACRVPVPNAQNLVCESLIFWVSSPDGSLVLTLAHVSHVKTRDLPCLTSS
jgi:hypothetical protein